MADIDRTGGMMVVHRARRRRLTDGFETALSRHRAPIRASPMARWSLAQQPAVPSGVEVRGVRPRPLCQVLDDAGNMAVALDQKNVTRLERFS